LNFAIHQNRLISLQFTMEYLFLAEDENERSNFSIEHINRNLYRCCIYIWYFLWENRNNYRIEQNV